MIGILTFQATNNFGACLHTIALQRKISELGYPCEIIDYRCTNVVARETASFHPGCSPRRQLSYILNQGYKYKRKFYHLQYDMRKFAHVGSMIYDSDNIHKANKVYDVFMVGSDVVWSLRINGHDYHYFLDFVEANKRKLAFSSSVGETNCYRDDTHLPDLLRKFNHIAVREEEAIDWIKSICGRTDVDYVCDPTMLYNAKEWDKILSPLSYLEDYVLVYFSNDKIIEDAISYAQKHKLRVVLIASGWRKIHGVEKVFPTTLQEFVGLIKHCRALFTGSYHGMLFSLYYQREVFYYNGSLKSRMASLGRSFHIEHHCGDVFRPIDATPINYRDVLDAMERFRTKSIEVLHKMLTK